MNMRVVNLNFDYKKIIIINGEEEKYRFQNY